jgi:AbrB family looped-hinge helix DNA binding protein
MGIFYVMRTTIDQAGRLVIPKDIRREAGIKPGMPLEIRWEKGAIAITPHPCRSSSNEGPIACGCSD